MKQISKEENIDFLVNLVNNELEKKYKAGNNKEYLKKLILAKWYLISGDGFKKILAYKEINEDIEKYLPEEKKINYEVFIP